MIFEGTITLGNVLTIASILTGGLVFLFTLRADLNALHGRVARVETGLEAGLSKMTDELIQVAKQEERLNAHADRISRLESDDS